MFLKIAAVCAALSFSETSSNRLLIDIRKAFDDHPRPAATGIRIGWDRRTLKRVSSAEFRQGGYARMIELRDGSLLCVYESDGSIMATKSPDGGKTWQTPVPVAWHQDGINMAAPDVLELADGSILCCYNPRPWKISGTRNFGIRTRKSYDGGTTWIHGRLIHEAGHKFKNGCWEPSAIQLPSGEIQLYFADEGAFRKSGEQNISMYRSHDGGLTWTHQPEIISFRTGARDGMPVPLLLKGGDDVVCAIEDLGWLGHFKPAIVRPDTLTTEAETIGALSPFRHAALRESIGYDLYAGAPYLRQLSTGETLLSYQGTERRKNDLHHADMKVVIGDASARSFNRKSVPFDIPADKFALWNSLCVMRDNTVIAVTSTNAFSRHSEVWMIKGHVIPEITADEQTLHIDGNKYEYAWDGPMPVFIGRDGQVRLRSGICYDDEYLYLFSRIDDNFISYDSADAENNDAVTLALSMETTFTNPMARAKPDQFAYKFTLAADNVLIAKQGNGRHWSSIPIDDQQVRHASKVTDSGYVQELGIPWKLLGGKPAAGERMGINVSVTENSGENVPDYRESISGNHEDKPYTWLSLRLR